MCGIVGYIGENKPASFLIEKLKKLEYRGYDSSGIADLSNNILTINKAVGNISQLEKKLDKSSTITCAIAHTRWATHGVPSENNAHPHTSTSGEWTIVHNGIIENYLEIKSNLKTKNNINSETDTAVVAELLQENKVDDILSFIKSCKMLTGGYAFVAINRAQPNTLYLARNKSPLYASFCNGEVLVASDPICFCGFSNKYFQLESGEFALATKKGIEFYDCVGEIVNKQEVVLEEIFEDVGKGVYPHFMLKEIMEQKTALKRIVKTYTDNNVFSKLDKDFLSQFIKIEFVGCGTAYHAGLMGARYIEKLVKLPASSITASEFIYNDPLLNKRTLYIFVSQSGETADTLRAIELVKSYGCKTIALTNVLYSTLAKIADIVLPCCAGPEISVASTKAYTCQIGVLFCLAKHMENVLFKQSYNYLQEISGVADVILNFNKDKIEQIAEELKNEIKCIYIGKDLDCITAQEGALKLKEIAYIEASSYPAGELKHGFLALIEKGTFIFVLANNKKINSKTYNSAHEAVSRGARSVLVGNKSNEDNFEPNFHVELPEVDEMLLPLVAIAPLQYLAYRVSVKKGVNPDQPRNLAKSVTVE